MDAALERGGLRAGSRVLEVGCGTGKLTELLAARGLRVEAVDPGPNMVATARRRVGAAGAVDFRVGRFEDADIPRSSFDAVFSATAFHWLDPEVAWQKAAAALVPGGLLALLTHTGLRDERAAPAEDAFAALLREHAPEVGARFRPSRDLATILAGAAERRDNVSEAWDWIMGEGRHDLAVEEARDLFRDVEVAIAGETAERTAEEILAHFRTTSLWFQVDPGRRRALEDADRDLIERFGGTIHVSWATVLVTARRAARGAR